MTNKLFCNRGMQLRTSKSIAMFLMAACWLLAGVPRCRAGDAPQWMHALVNAPLPEHDEKTDAVLLYSETERQRDFCRQGQDASAGSVQDSAPGWARVRNSGGPLQLSGSRRSHLFTVGVFPRRAKIMK